MARLWSLETSDEVQKKDLLKVGKTGRPHGIDGRLKIDIYPEFVQIIPQVHDIFIEKKKLRIESVVHQVKGRFIIKLSGVKCREQAGLLSNSPVFIPKDLIENNTDIGVFSAEQLEGRDVVDINEFFIGVVKSIYRTGHCDYIELEDGELIPFIRQHIIDVDDDRILVKWEKEDED
ncbi:MAG: ribosome maturation factor RimM [Candidatus Muiribacteriaceae bacterium]